MKKLLILLLLTTYYLLPTAIIAQSVDLLWQGETYTPPFYQGKTLWSKQSTITLIAIPQGFGSASGLNYRWTKNDTVLGNKSGIGKNTITYIDTILSKPQRIRVDIMSGTNVSASASIVVTPSSPILTVYENNPLYGFMFHKETSGTYDLKDREVTFGAFPVFFSTMNRFNNKVNYEWKNNAGSKETLNAVTYRAPDDASGEAEVSVRISSPSKITQESKKNFLIRFNNSTPNL